MVTIAKALKIKNRVAEKLRKAEKEFMRVNSYRVDLGVDNPPEEVWDKLVSLRSDLWHLKSAIAKANAPVQDAIFEMAEIKAEISYLGGLTTTNGKVAVNTNRYAGFSEDSDSDKFVEYKAYFNRKEVEERVEDLQADLDTLQERLDHFNNTTKIDVAFLGE